MCKIRFRGSQVRRRIMLPIWVKSLAEILLLVLTVTLIGAGSIGLRTEIWQKHIIIIRIRFGSQENTTVKLEWSAFSVWWRYLFCRNKQIKYIMELQRGGQWTTTKFIFRYSTLKEWSKLMCVPSVAHLVQLDTDL